MSSSRPTNLSPQGRHGPWPDDDWQFETRAIHRGQSFKNETGAVIAPIYATSTFAYGNPAGFDYTRSGNPTFSNFEDVIAGLEGARFCTSFASGVSAITAIVSTLQAGDRILAEENLYGCTFRLFERVFRKFGVEAVYCDLSKADEISQIARHEPALVWIESPTNPLLKIIDIRACANAAHACGAALVVDNTFASSYLQKPLALGADLSLLSATKYTAGHSDCLAGAICTDSEIWQDKLVFAQKALGLQPAPFDVWLATRGAKTQALRMERHSANAQALAEMFLFEWKCPWVRYPFLADDPGFNLAKSQMKMGSGIVSVDFNLSIDQTIEFLRRSKLFTLAESLGGIESLVCHPATMTHASVPREQRLAVGIRDSLVRFSVGVEHIEDLKRDLEQAWNHS